MHVQREQHRYLDDFTDGSTDPERTGLLPWLCAAEQQRGDARHPSDI